MQRWNTSSKFILLKAEGDQVAYFADRRRDATENGILRLMHQALHISRGPVCGDDDAVAAYDDGDDERNRTFLKFGLHQCLIASSR